MPSEVAEVEIPEGEVQNLTEGVIEDGKAEEETEEGKDEGKDEKVEDEVEVEDEGKVELQLLRQITREQKKELVVLKDALENQTKVLKDKGILTEEDTKVGEDEKAALQVRQGQLEFLAETMRVNPKYEDLDDVVSQEHFDDYVEAVAKTYIEKNGGNFDQVCKLIENKVWGMPNPYRFLYGEIKTYHPAYRKAEEKGKEEGEVKVPVGGGKAAPSSLSDIPGTGLGKGGWTASKIDALDESELDKVPQDVYQKYLQGELK
jgi:hypothetical protein